MITQSHHTVLPSCAAKALVLAVCGGEGIQKWKKRHLESFQVAEDIMRRMRVDSAGGWESKGIKGGEETGRVKGGKQTKNTEKGREESRS